VETLKATLLGANNKWTTLSLLFLQTKQVPFCFFRM